MTTRQPMATDKPLLAQIFYHGDEGARRSILFVRQHPGHVRIDELLRRTPDGRDLLELSRNLARAENNQRVETIYYNGAPFK